MILDSFKTIPRVYPFASFSKFKRIFQYTNFKYLWLFCFVSHCVSVESVEWPAEQVQKTLELYLNHTDDYAMLNSVKKNEKLCEIGIDPLPFSKQLLADIKYYEYWYEAVHMFVANEYKKNPVEMVDFLIDFMSKEEMVYNRAIVQAKSECLNVILQLVGPNFWQDAELKSRIVSFSKKFFSDGRPMDPEYWYEKYGMLEIASIPKENLTEKQSLDLAWAESAAKLSIQLAGFLYSAESDDYYLKLLQQCANSKFPVIQKRAEYNLSEPSRTAWSSGMYELYADVNPMAPMPKEDEFRKQMGELKGSTRTTKEKTHD